LRFDKLNEKSVVIPPIKSLTIWFDLINEYMEPINNNFDIESLEKKLIEKTINKITEIKDSIIKSAKIDFIHDLKNQLVDVLIKERIANGVIKINTFIITYLKEYENNKLINPKEVKDLINPLKEKILKVFSLIKLTAFIFFINSAKEISIWKKLFPNSLNDDENK